MYTTINYDIIIKLSFPNLITERGLDVDIFFNILISVVANVVSNRICKWLDENKGDN